MKANDLMIGDWVLHNTYPERIKLIGNTMVKVYTCDDTIDIDELCPIPLTAEILEKNGWSEDAHRFPEDENFYLELEVRGSEVWWTINMSEYDIIRLSYVHELQHALKLCKIGKEVLL